ncbi:MAG: hypothetical protein FWE53_01640 [Firmicutes bacterium]|nr:hypothetical protein [Bacillota bacterium]
MVKKSCVNTPVPLTIPVTTPVPLTIPLTTPVPLTIPLTMDKKEFFRITQEVFAEYGFKVDGKYFYLDLSEVHITAVLAKAHGIYFLGYNFSIKAIHEGEIKPRDEFAGHDSHLINMSNYKNERWLEYENMPKETYINDLKEMLPRYFNPYKKDAIGYIKKIAVIPGVIYKKDIVVIFKEAQAYLGIKY